MGGFSSVGQSILRVDSLDKARGRMRYADDVKLYNEAVGAVLYPRFPRAEIISIDTSKAQELPGVLKIITARDVPGKNELFGRFPVLAEKEVKYIGDAVACVAAEDWPSAQRALDAIEVKYKKLPGVFTLEDAVAVSETPVHADRPDNTMENTFYCLISGDAAEGLKSSDCILSRKYDTPFAVNGYVEPDNIVADIDPVTNGVVVYGCIQNVFSIRGAVCTSLGLPENNVRIVQSAIGGSFGGKNETAMIMASRAALLATLVNRPVRIRMSRRDIFIAGVKRHPYHFEIDAGVNKNGVINGWRNTASVIGGPYNNQAMFANWRASVHSAGPYRIPHVRTEIQAYYSNTPYAGAYRGFSAPQMCFAVESMIDELASGVGMDPAEFRRKNFVRSGDRITCGQLVDNNVMSLPLEKMLDDVLRRSCYQKKKKEFSEFNAQDKRYRKGLGFAATYRGCGLGGEGYDTGSAAMAIGNDGTVLLQSGMVEMGQGVRTSHTQIAAQVLGIPLEYIRTSSTDTSVVRDAGPTVASRGLSSGGMAVKMAADTLKERMLEALEKVWKTDRRFIEMAGGRVRDNEGRDVSFAEAVALIVGQTGVSLNAQGWFNPGVGHIDAQTGQGECYPTYLSGLTLTEVTVDLYSGRIVVPRVTMAYEVGCAVNPNIVRGQIVGGYTQGLGYALCEDFKTQNGKVQTTGFVSYLMPGIGDCPEFDLRLFEEDKSVGPFGAKGVGEIGVELAAPGVANAVFNATGVRVRSLPLNMEKMAPLFAALGG